MIKKLDISRLEHANEVLLLQRGAYLLEARLINYHSIPPLLETLEELVKSNEIFYGYFVEAILAGIISFKIEDKVLDIYRVAVSPSYLKRGIATKLITYIENLHKEADKVIVSTGAKNTPAVKLYSKLGYKEKGINVVQGGLEIISFEKMMTHL